MQQSLSAQVHQVTKQNRRVIFIIPIKRQHTSQFILGKSFMKISQRYITLREEDEVLS